MSFASRPATVPAQALDWPALMHELGPRFAARAADYDAGDAFVAENFDELKAQGVLAAAVPAELGGGGASYPELCAMLRALARYCGSTALTLSMHTHTVATAVWRWRRDPQPVEGLLRRVAADRLLLVGSGASDWLTPSGRAERVEGGWRVSAKKIFASGSPSGDLLLTQAVYDDPGTGPTALHFAIPLGRGGAQLQDTWRVLGMRGTGSHDVVIENAFVPDAAVSLRRPARQRADDPGLVNLVGEMENDLAAARMAHRDMVEAAAACEQPGPEITNRVLIARTLTGRAAIRVVEKAMEVAGGAAFFRAAGLERLFRDVQGARFHRPQERTQLRFSGRLALGLDIDE